jgi:tetratricopeptide (TPR) repeat protein
VTNEHLLRDYLSESSVVIVDPVASARVSLASSLAKMGASRQKMSLVSSIEEAKFEIETLKPRLIFTEYQVGKDLGLDLIQSQKIAYEPSVLKNSVFILVTSNASQAAVARAAEEDVDSFIIRPFTFETLKNALQKTVQEKIAPSKYLQLIEEGKQELFKLHHQKALSLFELAMHEHLEPTLAYFYAGQAEFMKSALEKAVGNYQKGLSINKIHYKCLIGLFSLLHAEKNYTEAYEVARVLAQVFPVNAKRLATVLRLVVITENFSDMDEYYQIFLGFEERSEELTRHMRSAMLVTGKFYLRKRQVEKALTAFRAASDTSGGRPQFLLYIIEALVDHRLAAEAEQYSTRLSELSPDSKEALAAKFLLSTLSKNVEDSVVLGRQIVQEGVLIASVYEKLIAQCVRGGHPSEAEVFYEYARAQWPDQEGNFAFALDSESLSSGLNPQSRA